MRLALIISSLAAGGSQRVLCTLANKWLENGHDVAVLTDAPTSVDHFQLSWNVKRIILNVQTDSLRLRDRVSRNILRVRRLRTALKDIAPDVVVAFGDTINARAILACMGSGVHTLVSERTDPRQNVLPLPWRVLRRLLYPFATCVVVQTKSVARWARTVVPASRVRVIPNPIRQFLPTAPRPDTLGARCTVIAVGRLSREKGFDLLVHAFASAALPASDWQLVILGDGPERAALEGQIFTLGLRVLMPGIVTEPAQWLPHADLFVLPSRLEGFPNALLEAMQCGLPAVAFDCPSGPREIIRNGETGVLVPNGDTNALAAAIYDLALDPDLRHRLGSAAAQDVAQRFSLDCISALWEDVLGAVTIETPREAAGDTHRAK